MRTDQSEQEPGPALPHTPALGQTVSKACLGVHGQSQPGFISAFPADSAVPQTSWCQAEVAFFPSQGFTHCLGQ